MRPPVHSPRSTPTARGRTRRLALALAAALVMTAPAACSLGGSAPPETIFRLEAQPTEPSLLPVGQIEVLAPRVSGSLAGSLGLLVSYQGEVVRVDEIPGGRWEDPPAEVMETALRTLFLPRAEAGLDGPRWRLSWSVDRMEAVVPPGATDPVETHAVLTWTLRRERDADDWAAGTIEDRVPVPPGADLTALVLAYNQAATRALARLAEAVATATQSAL